MGLTAPTGAAAPHSRPIRVTERCQGCGACLLTCPERAIRPRAGWVLTGTSPLEVIDARCTGCGECVEVCPADAIEES